MYYKEMLSKQKPLDDVAISKWLGSIVNTHFGLREAHNVDALVKTVQELVSSSPLVFAVFSLICSFTFLLGCSFPCRPPILTGCM
jgi:hypothetical protein